MRKRTTSFATRFLQPWTQSLMSPTGVIVCGMLLLTLIWLFCARVLYQSHRDAYLHAVDNAHNLVLLLERDIARNVELYDLSLQAVVDGVNDPRIMALDPAIRAKVLFDRAATGKYLGTISVMNEHGDIVLDSHFPHPPAVANFSYRDYFVYQRDHPKGGLYIGEPYAARLRHGAPTIALSRRITRADGSFGGVVVGTLGIDYFRSLLDGLSVGPDGTAAVFETNGLMITRLPFDPKMVGRSIADSALYAHVREHDAGVFTGVASIDGVRRLYVYKRLQGLPIVVNVSPAERHVFMQWRIRAQRLGVLMLVFGIAIVGGTALLARELRWRRHAEMRLQRLARTDALTGLGNRRAFDENLRSEWARALRAGRPLSLLFVDIDQFKDYNDHYGHQAGDDVLREVGGCLAVNVRRAADDVARYGGEEFVITLPDTDAKSAAAIAEYIRRAVYDLDIEHVRSPYARVTVSIGLVTSHEHIAHSDATLVKMADAALYQAKSTGRNRVCGAQHA
ncbi:diguanylate cyclase [Burkholderia pseudomallei]|nr:diguanylate cyclase [Burkholderia pseudomallei]MBM5583713.1 diguanylate cyclase [Burkholderia pseudomallei]RPA00657.1 GGDEF domain-containing protein [Burkholderia pseudomallei]